MFSRIRAPLGWTLTSVVLPEEWEEFDDRQSKAIDGDGGGTYAPTSQLEIGGAGLKITGPFRVESQAVFTSDVDISSGLAVGGACLLNNDVDITNDLSISGDCTFNGASTFHGTFTADGGMALALGTGKNLTISATGTGYAAIDAPSYWSNTITLQDKGTIAWRYNALGDADTTVAIGDGDIHRIPQVTTGTRTYTVDDTDAVDGTKMEFTRIYSGGHTGNAVVSANGGALLINISDGSGDYLWVQLVFDGSDWLIAAKPYPNP